MNKNLGRANLWDDATWSDIDAAVLNEVGRVRVVQKVFPTTPVNGGADTGQGSSMANFVPADIFDPEHMRIAEGQTRPFMEIAVDFALTLGQVENEKALGTARTLSRLAAKSLALAEDALLFQGDNARLPATVRVVNRDSAGDGLLGLAAEQLEVPPGYADAPGIGLFAAVTTGLARLIEHGQPAPYALFLESSVYASAFAPLPNSLVTTADRLTPLLEGGLYGTGALPRGYGVLVCLAGDPTTIYIAQDAVTAFTQEDREGMYRFRVFERLQYVARDHRSLLRLHFEAPAADAPRPAARARAESTV